jgi:uncharacterized protein YecE (DUF72 family)
MVDLWYPKGVTSPEQRLRYYASKFDTVEVDSSFYGIPRREYAEGWARRTPADFVFHVKAYGMMTGHDVDVRSLPPEMREMPHTVERGRVRRPSPEMVDASFEAFLYAIEPLREASKLGGILMQFPPYFTATDGANERRGLEYLEYVGERLDGYRTLVEFRHPSWVDETHIGRTLGFLADRGMSFVSVDSPQIPGRPTMPPTSALTSDWAYVRFHGRNRETWFARTETAADRFDYLYTSDELREWEPQIRGLAEDAKETFVLFNNNKYDYAQRNATEIVTILGDLVPPRAEPGEATPHLF